MPKLDEQAISITIPGDMEETNHIREALWQELSTPLPLVLQGSRKSQTSTDQIIFTQLQITQGEYYLLRDCRQIAASTQNKKAFIEYIKTLPQSLFSEIEQKASESASSSYEIKHLLVHDPIEKGFRLVNGNFHILKKVFDKSEKIQNRYGYSPHQLSCSTKKERDLFQKLISHIYETPMNLKAIETIFKTSEFKPVKDQLCQVSYFNFISEQLELLIENILFTERVEIIDKIIKSKELQIEYFKSHLEATRLMASPAREIDKKKIYKSKELTLSHLKDEDLTEFKLGLLIEAKKTISTLKTKEQISEYMRTLPEELRNLITNQMLQKAKSTSRIKKMLSQDLLQKNGRDILDKKLETLLKTFANNTELQLYYDRSFDTLHFENDKEREIYDELIQTFYEIPINMVKVHNIFYHKDFRNVRNQIRELVSLNIYSHEINRTCEELSSKELPEVLDLLISNFQQIISISTEQPEKTMASADCEFISTKKDATTRDTIIFCQISEQIKKCKTGTSITLLLNTIPEREIDLIRTELYKSIMESNRSINEMLKLDPIESGKKALNENLLAIQKIFTSEEILRKVFGNSSQITVPPNEQADYNSMLALILSDSKDKKQKIDKLFYHSSISTQTRNEIRKLVYLQQIGLIIEFEANRIMTDPRYLNQEGIKELLLATLKKLQEK
ncbi:MAG: hypothetical protein FJZ57_02170 [Chlamydiae bacterium]|nr:hypothetical protein [Chlamydiota bacterium]